MYNARCNVLTISHSFLNVGSLLQTVSVFPYKREEKLEVLHLQTLHQTMNNECAKKNSITAPYKSNKVLEVWL